MNQLLTYFVLGFLFFAASAQAQTVSKNVTYSALKGLERDPDGFNRRDNSDIIKGGDLYYVWYSTRGLGTGTNNGKRGRFSRLGTSLFRASLAWCLSPAFSCLSPVFLSKFKQTQTIRSPKSGSNFKEWNFCESHYKKITQ